MKNPVFILVLLVCSIFQLNYTHGQSLNDDKNSIKNMCGCFEIEFNFAETFSFVKDSTYKPSKNYQANALEWAQLVSENDNKIVIQHILQMGNDSNSFIIKHWRQDWIYENTNLYEFYADNKWNYKNLNSENVKGQWTQKVYQVDDSPRYEGSSSWVHVDGKNYWENTTDAPLPRREYTKRSDYNITKRGNRHEIVENGWIHDQDNYKIIREAGKKDFVIAQEKGISFYNKVDDSKCKAAANWWQENKDFWGLVRSAWDEIYNQNIDLELAEKVDGKRLYEVLFSMDINTSKKKIKKTIKSYVVE